MPESAPPSPYNARLIERQDFNDALSIFRFAYDDGPVPEFEPGQYTTLGLIEMDENGEPVMGRRGPKLLRRAYSIASPPKDRDTLSFYIVRVDEGALTPKLWKLQPGDPVFMDAKIKGHFTLADVPNGKNLVMIGTGTGLAPYVSMLHQYRGTGRWDRVVLMDGVRLAIDLGYLEELTRLAEDEETLTYLPTVTREPEGSSWSGLQGRVTALLEDGVFEQHTGFTLSPETCHVFLCGNPAMIDQCEALLMERGFSVKDRKNPDGTIHFERYW